MDTDEDKLEQEILEMDLFYKQKPEISSQNLIRHSEMLLEIGK